MEGAELGQAGRPDHKRPGKDVGLYSACKGEATVGFEQRVDKRWITP